jgi:hypothetical protein
MLLVRDRTQLKDLHEPYISVIFNAFVGSTLKRTHAHAR